MSLSIAAHELIYVADALRRQRPPPPPRVLGRHARGVPARRRRLRRRRCPDRGRAVEARGRAGLLPVRVRARRQPHRGHHGRVLRLRPRLRADHVDRGGARAGPVLGRADHRELPHVRHARRRRGGCRPGGAVTLHTDAQQFLDLIAESGAPPLTSMTPRGGARGVHLLHRADRRRAYVAVVRDIEIPGPWLVNVMESADLAVAEAGAAIGHAVAAKASA